MAPAPAPISAAIVGADGDGGHDHAHSGSRWRARSAQRTYRPSRQRRRAVDKRHASADNVDAGLGRFFTRAGPGRLDVVGQVLDDQGDGVPPGVASPQTSGAVSAPPAHLLPGIGDLRLAAPVVASLAAGHEHATPGAGDVAMKSERRDVVGLGCGGSSAPAAQRVVTQQAGTGLLARVVVGRPFRATGAKRRTLARTGARADISGRSGRCAAPRGRPRSGAIWGGCDALVADDHDELGSSANAPDAHPRVAPSQRCSRVRSAYGSGCRDAAAGRSATGRVPRGDAAEPERSGNKSGRSCHHISFPRTPPWA